MSLMTIEPLRRGVPRPDVKYVRAIRPLHFPVSDPEWQMGQSHRHMRLCEVLYHLLCGVLPGEHATVGADQFVYFDPRDPRRKCAPDAFVKLGVPAEAITSWKTWEKGAPELCVEILSDTEEKQTLPEKLERFGAMGVLEVVVFDADAPVGSRIRAWESVKGDLVERVVERESTFSVVLGKWFVVAPYLAEGLPALFRLEAALRLADDADGKPASLVPTPDERRLAEESARADAERARAEAQAARADAAEAELAKLRERLG